LRTFNNVAGLIIVGISPTSQIGVIGRVIGYTKNNVLYAHPIWHLLKSRQCNGVSDSITLLLDVLVNFSREFIPAFHGGTLDTPTVLNLVDNWKDLMLYSKSNAVMLNQVFYKNLGKISQESKLLSYNFSLLNLPPITHHITENLSEIAIENKLREQKIVNRINIALASLRIIRAVEEGVFVDNILVNDFLNKITTSIARFFQQPFRCKICKRTFRRVPLRKNCPYCYKNTLELTLSKGWVLRYMQIISQLTKQYPELSESTKSWIRYIEMNKNLLFEIGPKPTTLFFDQDT
jgi:DNA polymerase II large subunit